MCIINIYNYNYGTTNIAGCIFSHTMSYFPLPVFQDMIKFGFSSREYVLLHENSHNDDPPASTVDPPS